MKKILTVLTAGFMTAALLTSCSDGGSSNNDNTPDVYVEGVEPEDPAGEVPDNALRNWTYDDDVNGAEWVIFGYEDLKKLIEVVNLGEDNDGSTFSGETILLANDLVLNKSVLGDDFTEPVEFAPGTPTSGLLNLDSIGRKYSSKDLDADEDNSGDRKFAGTFDGQGHTISGYYSYQGHQGLGFFGLIDGATIKNLILTDACVVNCNIWTGFKEDGVTPSHDGSDDDRFGGLVGISFNSTIENCVFVGVVGSKEAYARDSMYEYIGGLIGRCESATTAKDNLVYAKTYGSSAPICNKGVENITNTNTVGKTLAEFDEDTLNEKIEAIKKLVAEAASDDEGDDDGNGSGGTDPSTEPSTEPGTEPGSGEGEGGDGTEPATTEPSTDPSTEPGSGDDGNGEGGDGTEPATTEPSTEPSTEPGSGEGGEGEGGEGTDPDGE